MPTNAGLEIEPLGAESHVWLRCAIEFGNGPPSSVGELNLGATTPGLAVWLNGEPLAIEDRRGVSFARIPLTAWSRDDADQLVLRLPREAWSTWSRGLLTVAIEETAWRLEGNWEVRAGAEGEPWTKLPLPPRFGGAANIVFPF